MIAVLNISISMTVAVLLLITAATFVVAMGAHRRDGGVVPIPIALPLWAVGNLLMWFIYFIIT